MLRESDQANTREEYEAKAKKSKEFSEKVAAYYNDYTTVETNLTLCWKELPINPYLERYTQCEIQKLNPQECNVHRDGDYLMTVWRHIKSRLSKIIENY
eukprot:1187511-Rhodomonas_salina.2